jgi:4,5-DOPA dioxygenase extradiol
VQRKDFLLKAMTLLPLTGAAATLRELGKMTEPMSSTRRMPVLFFGHGSPMNAIEDNEFVQGWKNVAATLPKPAAILCISAHWETNGTFVTAMPHPPTIHDFGGFPRELFQVEYPAPGSPELARATKELITTAQVGLDDKWGLDHGCWSVVRHLYPAADVPVIQMSLDYNRSPRYHYELAKELSALRDKGILIIGSGNMVHNLRLVAWDRMQQPDFGFDWAIEANEKMKSYILAGNYQPLIDYKAQGKAFELAIPTADHFLPLLYILSLQQPGEKVSLFNDKALLGSLTMTSLKIDKA